MREDLARGQAGRHFGVLRSFTNDLSPPAVARKPAARKAGTRPHAAPKFPSKDSFIFPQILGGARPVARGATPPFSQVMPRSTSATVTGVAGAEPPRLPA
ncbi:hypothetical protein Ga0080574_TMP4259 [Salipiger abyssi]|uniref:Uncharacterized protein n=1 Tax=Salipiger abyssi TaxID=1250539 RepID=A0A1P8UYX3_9RHOB|nr:hypothetical protein Ga0080574_TMP4259 [Salipiger abyssi]